ncbi:hypothetical protein EDD86DRAFT_257994 [Gorgonomyces haynaldii]|nr:hypothetical protein EDD86DRAFT_257994 [Gorgonomyces haynaldii]
MLCFCEMTLVSIFLALFVYFSGRDYYVVGPNNAYCYLKFDDISDWTLITIFMYLIVYSSPIMVVGYVYYKIWIVLRQDRLTGTKDALSSVMTKPREDKMKQLQANVAKRGIFILSAFIIGYAGAIIYFFARAVFRVRFPVISDMIVAWLMISNVLINPIIYYFVDDRVKNAVDRFFGKREQEKVISSISSRKKSRVMIVRSDGNDLETLSLYQLIGAYVSTTLSVSGFIVVSFVLYIFITTPGLSNYQNAFSFAQIVIDFITGVFYIIDCSIALAAPHLLDDISLFSILHIPINPFLVLVLKRPVLSFRMTLVCLFEMVAVAAFLSNFVYFSGQDGYVVSPNHAYCYLKLEDISQWTLTTIYVALFLYCSPIMVVMYCYYRIWLVLRQDRELSSSREASKTTSSNPREDKMQQLQTTIAKRGVAVLGAFLFGYSGSILFFFSRAILKMQFHVLVDVVIAWLMISNVLINSVVYYLTDERVKNAVDRILFQKEAPKSPEHTLGARSRYCACSGHDFESVMMSLCMQLNFLQTLSASVSLGMAVVATAMTTCLLYIFIKTPVLRHYNNAFSFGQIVTDFLTCMLYIAECLLALTKPDQYNDYLTCQLIGVSISMSLFFILLIPLNPYRVLVLKKPLLNQAMTILAIIAAFLLALILAVWVLFNGKDSYVVSPNYGYCYYNVEGGATTWTLSALIVSIIFYGTPIMVIVYIYYRLYTILLHNQKMQAQARDQYSIVAVQAVNKVDQAQEHIAKRGFLTLLAFLLGYGFAIVYFLARGAFKVQFALEADLGTAWMMVSNLITNPIIYYYTDPRVQSAARKALSLPVKDSSSKDSNANTH